MWWRHLYIQFVAFVSFSTVPPSSEIIQNASVADKHLCLYWHFCRLQNLSISRLEKESHDRLHPHCSTGGSCVYIEHKQHCKNISTIADVICTDNNHQRHNAQCSHALVILEIYSQMLMCQKPGCTPSLFSLNPHGLYRCNAIESLQHKNNSRCPLMAGLQNE